MASPNKRRSDSNSEEDNGVDVNDKVSVASSSDVGSVESNSTDHDQSVMDKEITASPFKEESRVITRYKTLTLIAIAAAAVGCGIATYFIVASRQNQNFQSKFTGYAMKVSTGLQVQANDTSKAMNKMGVTITTLALTSNNSLPEFTVPHFEVRGTFNNRISQTSLILFAPLVKKENKEVWDTYSVENQGWINESLALAAGYLHEDRFDGRNLTSFVPAQISPNIYRFMDYTTGKRVVQMEPGVQYGPGNYAPLWQQAPVPTDTSMINFDLLSHPDISRLYHEMWDTQSLVISEVTDLDFLTSGDNIDDRVHPRSFLLQPVYGSFERHGKDDIAAILMAVVDWDAYYSTIIFHDNRQITIYTRNSCGGRSFTYLVDGSGPNFLGEGDLHNSEFDDFESASTLYLNHSSYSNQNRCVYEMHIYPTAEMKDLYINNKPFLYAFLVVGAFFFMALLFVLYDHHVTQRHIKMEAIVKYTTAIVSSLFPANVRDRILKNAELEAERDMLKKDGKTKFSSTAAQLKDYMGEANSEDPQAYGSMPIADLFPSATVMFADIVGFTAWSSVREPCQVFTLLETLYQSFDEIAKRRRVFKVETIGDCYVAVAGLPEPRSDHAVVMARFARDCHQKMITLTSQLERSLGPDTGDLTLRLGLHSGPVTAGVLRGDKGRFQLFGDTVNTAARMESNGERDRIHISKETAALLIEAGKGAWLCERAERVTAKGKGELQTFWLEFAAKNGSRTGSSRSGSMGSSTEDSDDPDAMLRSKAKRATKLEARKLDEKMERLVDWNTDVLARLLKQILARHRAMGKQQPTRVPAATRDIVNHTVGSMVIDEVVEIIELPELHAAASRQQELAYGIELDPAVITQLRSYISTMASMYRGNPFHNFEHASHVTMSVTKLLSRIVAPSEILANEDCLAKDLVTTLHDHTYGINSDPLTQFACVFAALIHDVDHTGLSNAQLVKEKAEIALAYNNKSVAEQNSVDVAWDLLMDPKFDQLRGVLFANAVEMKRFRQLVVNSVMATDIMDVDLKTARNNRWNKAFNGESSMNSRDHVNRKATIVIEHLIQASDVAHTMQHWHIYRKWNERLFLEMLKAYRDGHAEKDPTEFWYQGELGFFDFYIIPLANKLKDCGVFGVSSDEYLNYAQKNRQEWEQRGQEVVAAMVEKYKAEEEASEAPKPEVQVSGDAATKCVAT